MRYFIIALLLLVAFITVCVYSFDLNAENPLKEALFYSKLDNKIVQCRLCPRKCVIPEGRRGFCRVRENRDGKLYSLVYNRPVAIHLDPIEKKPLFHFFPSTKAYSVATVGCNLRCKFCQNWQISQATPEEINYMTLTPQELVSKAKGSGSFIIAYTYTEPTVFYEYMLETAKIARSQGLKNVVHSAGYINEEPLRTLAKFLDAANIDLKGFSDDYYKSMSEGSLEPVLHTLKVLKDEGVHIEITNLVVPGYNDDSQMVREMCLWIRDNLGPDTPIHFSRFFPMYKLTSVMPTPVDSLERIAKIAKEAGLNYVYIGNAPGNPAENTYCPKCGNLLIQRKGYFVLQDNIEDGRCKFCKEKVSGVWK